MRLTSGSAAAGKGRNKVATFAQLSVESEALRSSARATT